MIATLEPGVTPRPANTIAQLCQTVSASRLNTWLACRLKFYFRYVAGLTKPKTGALQVGSTVHAALRLANLARWRRQPLSLEALRQQFILLWQDEKAKSAVPWEEGEEAVERVTAWNLVDFYLKQSPIPPNELAEGVEVSLEADLSQHGLPRLIGILDLVRAGGRIVDYKTVAQTPQRRAGHPPERSAAHRLRGPVSGRHREERERARPASVGQDQDAEARHHAARPHDRTAAKPAVPPNGKLRRGRGPAGFRSFARRGVRDVFVSARVPGLALTHHGATEEDILGH